MAVANLSSERVVPCLGIVVRTLLVGNGGIEDIPRDWWELWRLATKS